MISSSLVGSVNQKLNYYSAYTVKISTPHKKANSKVGLFALASNITCGWPFLAYAEHARLLRQRFAGRVVQPSLLHPLCCKLHPHGLAHALQSLQWQLSALQFQLQRCCNLWLKLRLMLMQKILEHYSSYSPYMGFHGNSLLKRVRLALHVTHSLDEVNCCRAIPALFLLAELFY